MHVLYYNADQMITVRCQAKQARVGWIRTYVLQCCLMMHVVIMRNPRLALRFFPERRQIAADR